MSLDELNFSIASYPQSPFLNLQKCIEHVQIQLQDMHVKVGAGHTPTGRL